MENMTLLLQGEDINLTLDAELQRYGAAVNKRGGIVAIEPKTGETSFGYSTILRSRNFSRKTTF
jgi:hypothetical protein